VVQFFTTDTAGKDFPLLPTRRPGLCRDVPAPPAQKSRPL